MPASNELKLETLRRVRKYVEDCIARDGTPFLCHGLSEVALEFPERLGAACCELEAYVMRGLKPKSSLQEWHEDNGFGDRGIVQRRKDRLAWVDWMILCLEGWEPWPGGKQPVGNQAIVEVRFRNGEIEKREAGLFRWCNWKGSALDNDPQRAPEDCVRFCGRDIVAFKVIEVSPWKAWYGALVSPLLPINARVKVKLRDGTEITDYAAHFGWSHNPLKISTDRQIVEYMVLA